MWNVAISIYDIYDGAFHLFQIIRNSDVSFETTPIRNNEVFLLWSGWLPNKFVLLH